MQHRPPDAHTVHLDHLRGLAILAVLLHHLSAFAKVHVPYLGSYGGLLGVQLFFVLSGYLIVQSASRHTLGAYAWHRVLRIFPAYWVAYLFVGFIGNRLSWAEVIAQPWAFVMNLANLQQLHAVALLDFDTLSVSWTLTVEVLWYLTAPLVAWLGWRHPWRVMLLLVAVSVGWTWAAATHRLDALYASQWLGLARPPTHDQKALLTHAAFPAQWLHFGWGALAFWYREPLRRLPAALPLAAALLILAPLPWYAGTAWSPLLSGLGVAAFFQGVMRLPPLRLRALALLGTVSYSVYLLHFPVLVYSSIKYEHLGAWKLLIAAGLLALSAGMLHWFVERPGMALARRLTRAVG